MPIPDATREDVLSAMARFDAELRDTDGWLGWEERANHKYAIEHEGKRYPVKQAVLLGNCLSIQAFGARHVYGGLAGVVKHPNASDLRKW